MEVKLNTFDYFYLLVTETFKVYMFLFSYEAKHNCLQLLSSASPFSIGMMYAVLY